MNLLVVTPLVTIPAALNATKNLQRNELPFVPFSMTDDKQTSQILVERKNFTTHSSEDRTQIDKNKNENISKPAITSQPTNNKTKIEIMKPNEKEENKNSNWFCLKCCK
ncbi:hypothetical protein PVAND_016013 [Polypedilum vanderplanki]|uniref:Uncharacterized protein n=1 Tax=Polypedilum vanderplanki TaxID=319348 RepID=A0A9J6BDV4_POLVA|nr:hypothetical protein PVAND_016013 [Polypedilum vanderplanki]